MVVLIGNLASVASATTSANKQGARKTLSTVAVSILSGSAGFLPIYVAEGKGYFKKWGIQIQPVPTASFPAMGAALEGGSVDISEVSDIYVEYEAGLPLVGVVGSSLSAPYFNLVCNNSVRAQTGTAKQRLQAIVGHKIAFSGIGSPPYNELAQAMAYNGLNIDQVTAVNLSVGAPEYAALEAGDVSCMIGNANDVAVLVPTYAYLALNFGANGALPKLLQNYVGQMVATSSWADSHKSDVYGFERGFTEAVLWLQNPKNLKASEKYLLEAISTPPPTAAALTTEAKAVIRSITALWGLSQARNDYKADLLEGTIKPIPGYEPATFVAPGAAGSLAAEKNLVSGGKPGRY